MKILFVTEFFPSDSSLKFTGGVETRVYHIAKNLSQKETVFIICRKTKDLIKPKQIGNISVYPCGLSVLNIEANFFSVFERVIFFISAFIKGISVDFDLVEGSNFVSYLPAFFLGFIKRKPRVAWYADVLKGNWIKFFGITGIFGGLVEKISLGFQWSKIISLSKSTKKKLIEEGINERKIEVVYGGVDYKSIKGKKVENIKSKNIICISRLVKYKRVGDLINVFASLSQKFSSITLNIVGQGPEEKKLKQLVKEKGLDAKVEFLKNLSRDNLIRLLKKSYIFCLPSIVEGFGLVTIEAVACQTPYVITNISVNKEITNNGQGGLLFKKKNIRDLQEKLEILLKDKNLYQQKQKEGLKLANNYRWDKIADQTKQVYMHCINK